MFLINLSSVYISEIHGNIILMFIQVGGNLKARTFFESQPDYKPDMKIQQKYNTKAAAMYRQKVSCILLFKKKT